VGGSIPEVDDNKNYYNTSLVFDKQGAMIAKYRKAHLFDIDIPGKVTYKESAIFAPGDQMVVFDTEFCKMGIAICYDIRFPELALLMAKKGAKVLFYPSNFTMATGPLHWELLLKCRALDNQTYVAGCSQVKYTDDPNVYQSWGHSTIVDPMGKVLESCEFEEKVLYTDIDLDYLDSVRNQIPNKAQKRYDIYNIIDSKDPEVKQ
jgi:omega-amidase